MYALGARGTSRQLNDETPEQNEKMIVYGPERFLNDGPANKSAVWGKFCRFVSTSVRHFGIETEEPSSFQFFDAFVSVARPV